ncbi:MAG: hypothetical protein KatS3mg129_2159 [Leptospiraceae bacterium]|nr:MAG: hypothetical protein KatS3mg129_2159 [Leptospiraceae bacterium]
MKNVKKNITKFILFISILGLVVGCGGTFYGPQGLFTKTTIGVYGSDLNSSKEGKSCAFSILSLVALGDASLQTAAKNGGIKNIKQVDYENLNIIGIYSRLCTVVRGD